MAMHMAPSKKPRIPRENPDFGTPPLENRSVSILDGSRELNI